MAEHLPCYGRLFPPSAFRESGKDRPEAVFGFVLAQAGSVRRPPEVTVDFDAWDRCVACPEFSSCQQLSVAKMLLEMAVQ